MTHNQKIHQADEQFRRAAIVAEAAMTPYLDKMETDDGLLGLLMISGIAACVQSGTATPADLANAISKASEISGIPVSALEAQAKFNIAMIAGFMLTQSH